MGMGCGTSKLGPAVAENLIGSSLIESARRKKNTLSKHCHLLNLIDESVDSLRTFRELGIQVQQPWHDWKAFLHDKNDNPEEEQVFVWAISNRQLAEVMVKLGSMATEQMQIDLEYLRKQNAYIATLRQIHHELKVFD